MSNLTDLEARQQLADARRDVAAIGDSALPAYLVALGGDVFRIEHAKQRIHSMMIAAVDRVRAVKQPELADELDALVRTAIEIGVFADYEALLPHVARAPEDLTEQVARQMGLDAGCQAPELRDATAMAMRLAAANIPGAASLAAEAFESAVAAYRMAA